MIRVIDWNERRHQTFSQSKLALNSQLSTKIKSGGEHQDSKLKMRLMTPLQTLNSLSNKLAKER